METTYTDWNQVWTDQMTLWRQSAGKSCQEFWADEGSAQVYSKKYGGQNPERITKTLEWLALTDQCRVLDIGAGPGNIALPMAEQALSVTTVEPSPGMNAVMAQAVEDRGLTNIIRIEKNWEEADPDLDLTPPYDRVLASMSLGMANIRAAVEKMNQVCSGRVHLIWHAGIPEWEKMPRALWPDLFGKPYHGGPKSDILFQVLYQMGIYPQIRVMTSRFEETFPAMDQAMDFYITRFKQLEEQHYPMLETYLSDVLTSTGEGLVHSFEHSAMLFSWESPKEVL